MHYFKYNTIYYKYNTMTKENHRSSKYLPDSFLIWNNLMTLVDCKKHDIWGEY
jgi:hypothetical protein